MERQRRVAAWSVYIRIYTYGTRTPGTVHRPPVPPSPPPCRQRSSGAREYLQAGTL